MYFSNIFSVEQIVQPETKQPLDPMEALKEVLKKAAIHDGLAKGLRECCRALDKRTGYFCVLADNIAEKQYKQLIENLCAEANIDIIRVPDNMQLGEWIGLAKYDKNMKPRKLQKCGCVIVRDFGEESDALQVVLSSLKKGEKKADE